MYQNPEAAVAESTLLEAGFDPGSLGPGLYTAVSGTEAYVMLRAMIAAGDAEFVGERYLPDSRLAVSASVGGELGAGRGYAQNPAGSITIGREFFATALKDYRDWREKWWREAIQNSVDAGAHEIHLKSTDNPDGTGLVEVFDNGGGMTEDVLINKFLVLGATTKVGQAGAAGGFGKAKEMLLLPWLTWEVHSRDRVVKGAGIDYTVEPAEYLNGTRLRVLMPADQQTDASFGMNFIKKCWLPSVSFFVNDQRIKADLKPGKLIREVPDKANFYFREGGEFDTARMLIRARGLFMFDRFVGSDKDIKGNVIVELEGPSIKLLTANRDGIRDWELGNQIDAFAAEIAADVKSATRAKSGMIRQKYKGTGRHLSYAKQAEAGLIEAAGVLQRHGSADFSLEPANLAQMKLLIDQLSTAPATGGGLDAGGQSAETVDVIMGGMEFKGPEHLSAALKQMAWEPDFYLINEIEGFRVPSKFKPENMPPSILRLLKTWTELCRFVLIQLGARATFGVGFHFDATTGASYLNENEEHWLLINPIPYPEKRLLTPSNDEDLKWLYAAAIHECTHMADEVELHNEVFAAALTKNMARCADGYRKIRRIVRAIRWRAGGAGDGGEVSGNPDEYEEYEA